MTNKCDTRTVDHKTQHRDTVFSSVNNDFVVQCANISLLEINFPRKEYTTYFFTYFVCILKKKSKVRAYCFILHACLPARKI